MTKDAQCFCSGPQSWAGAEEQASTMVRSPPTQAPSAACFCFDPQSSDGAEEQALGMARATAAQAPIVAQNHWSNMSIRTRRPRVETGFDSSLGLTTFHPFPRFPAELRLEVWRLSLLESKEVHITHKQETVPRNRERTFFYSFSKSIGLLFVNQESRHEAQKVYALCFQGPVTRSHLSSLQFNTGTELPATTKWFASVRNCLIEITRTRPGDYHRIVGQQDIILHSEIAHCLQGTAFPSDANVRHLTAASTGLSHPVELRTRSALDGIYMSFQQDTLHCTIATFVRIPLIDKYCIQRMVITMSISDILDHGFMLALIGAKKLTELKIMMEEGISTNDEFATGLSNATSVLVEHISECEYAYPDWNPPASFQIVRKLDEWILAHRFCKNDWRVWEVSQSVLDELPTPRWTATAR